MAYRGRGGSRRERPCNNCKSMTTESHLGWRLLSGAYAILCNPCWSAFQQGNFCRIFHLKCSDWKFCEKCQTPIHYCCVMSFYHYVQTDHDGVMCKGCYDSLVALEKQRLSSHSTISKLLQRSYAGPSGTKDAAETEAPTNDVPVDPAIQMQAAPQGNGAGLSGPPGRRRDALVPDASGWVPLHPRRPVSAKNGGPPSTVSEVLVLEKRLSPKDADPKVGSITVPKAIAETHFCKLSPGQLAPVPIRDEEGVDWELFLGLELKGSRLAYTLEGLGHFISSGKCKAGDKVTFHKRSGKLFIGFIEGSA